MYNVSIVYFILHLSIHTSSNVLANHEGHLLPLVCLSLERKGFTDYTFNTFNTFVSLNTATVKVILKKVLHTCYVL